MRKKTENELLKSQKQLRELAEYIHSIREEERKQISRDVHDQLGQALTGIKIDLSWLNKMLDIKDYSDIKPITDKIKSITKVADDTIDTVRKISTQLRPSILDDL
ncbi:MAG: hypothetical protein GTO02_22675, partial [Candidatus Dadabacteria bacterium]|nr:hypothetical protein [Candidatus Dadabacteria bacterium]NIQ17083.1 hypothetical protein [Candidatus Dadabacteria bacterium]